MTKRKLQYYSVGQIYIYAKRRWDEKEQCVKLNLFTDTESINPFLEDLENYMSVRKYKKLLEYLKTNNYVRLNMYTRNKNNITGDFENIDVTEKYIKYIDALSTNQSLEYLTMKLGTANSGVKNILRFRNLDAEDPEDIYVEITSNGCEE